MRRCLELASNGSGFTAPNPMVGAVIVCDDEIIGEGFHRNFGGPHAEVNAINDAIERGNDGRLDRSTLYVSLEPCIHTGKTPPCADLIIRKSIPKVVIGCLDPFPEVNGRGVRKLVDAGVIVETGILQKECMELNRRFIIFHTRKRPFVLLKFAQTGNGIIGSGNTMRIKISNDLTDILVHKWRSEESAILVGTKTAEADNPHLTVRKWKGRNPVRVVIDRRLRLKNDLNIFDNSAATMVINEVRNSKSNNIEYAQIDFERKVPSQILMKLFERNILSVMIEGGAGLLNQFIGEKLWDEARIITSQDKFIQEGIPSPQVKGNIISSSDITGDRIEILRPQ